MISHFYLDNRLIISDTHIYLKGINEQELIIAKNNASPIYKYDTSRKNDSIFVDKRRIDFKNTEERDKVFKIITEALVGKIKKNIK